MADFLVRHWAAPRPAGRLGALLRLPRLWIQRASSRKQLLALGLMSQLPDTAADFDDPDDEPIEIRGEPLSETVIRERR